MRRSEASIVKISPLSGAGEKCVWCTPHPLLRTTFSHTVEKEEIDASPFTLHLSVKKRAAFTLDEGATHVAHSHNIRRVAFTLAEVLITLGIIGVVAALTMPSLINKYQMKSYEVAFKKQYSVLQNAINYSVFESGISECYLYFPVGASSYKAKKQDCDALRESLVSLIKLTPVQLDYVSYNYARVADVRASGGKTINDACTYDDFSGQNNVIYTYMTNDGAIVRLALSENYNYFPIIILDVNGLKGPNKWGYDVFFMTLTKRNRNGSIDQKIFLTDEYCSLVEKGGRLPRNILSGKEKNEDSDFTLLWN